MNWINRKNERQTYLNIRSFEINWATLTNSSRIVKNHNFFRPISVIHLNLICVFNRRYVRLKHIKTYIIINKLPLTMNLAKQNREWRKSSTSKRVFQKLQRQKKKKKKKPDQWYHWDKQAVLSMQFFPPSSIRLPVKKKDYL